MGLHLEPLRRGRMCLTSTLRLRDGTYLARVGAVARLTSAMGKLFDSTMHRWLHGSTVSADVMVLDLPQGWRNLDPRLNLY